MNLIFSMSLAGSIIFLLYLLTKPVTIQYFPSIWRSRMLKLSLLFYLLPYQYLKHIYQEIITAVLGSRILADKNTVFHLNRLVLIDSLGWHFTYDLMPVFVILGIWGIGMGAFFIYNISKYLLYHKDIKKITSVPDPAYRKAWEQCLSYLPARKKVHFSVCPYIDSPYTIGFFSHSIILPSTMPEREASMVIAHELVHIRNHDTPLKFLALLNILIHWYNPLAYFLYWEFSKTCEHVCDETVTQSMAPEEKECYQSLIIDLASKSHAKVIFADSFSNNYKLIKERMLIMSKTNTSAKIIRITSFSLAALMLLLSPLPVLAYSPGSAYRFEDPVSVAEQNSYFTVSCQLPTEACQSHDNISYQEAVSDIYTDANGTGYTPITDESRPEKAPCFHNWTDGTVYGHSPHEDGSCTLYIYSAKVCTICKSAKNITLYATYQYVTCPH